MGDEDRVARRDRVGLIAFGGILRWLVPGMGLVHLYRVVDALLDTQIVLSYYWKEIDVIPRRTLPPNALVIGLSPLLDPRSVGALLDLRHGIDVVRVLREVARLDELFGLIRWCDDWLPARRALVARVEAQLAWFAGQPPLPITADPGEPVP